VPSSDSHPDCCFIEDTIVFFKGQGEGAKRIIVINRMAAPTRQGEELAVASTLRLLCETHLSLKIVDLPSGNVDGGDVLFTGDCVLIGNSHRTDKEGIESLTSLLGPLDLPVFPIQVKSGLHLKSCCSLIDNGVIVIADNESGREVRSQIESLPIPFDFIVVPDGPASNVLRIGMHIVIQEGFAESQQILSAYAELRGLTIHKLQMSEFIKADGALTCCNVFVDF
jgi:dimethylargininase